MHYSNLNKQSAKGLADMKRGRLTFDVERYSPGITSDRTSVMRRAQAEAFCRRCILVSLINCQKKKTFSFKLIWTGLTEWVMNSKFDKSFSRNIWTTVLILTISIYTPCLIFASTLLPTGGVNIFVLIFHLNIPCWLLLFRVFSIL